MHLSVVDFLYTPPCGMLLLLEALDAPAVSRPLMGHTNRGCTIQRYGAPWSSTRPDAPASHASESGPSFWGPWFACILGGFCQFAPNSSKYFCRHYRPRGRPRRRVTSYRPPLLRWNDLGGYPCTLVGEEVFGHTLESCVMTCSGAVCFQNMEVRVLCKSAPGPVAVTASGSVSERPPIKGCSDVAVDGLGQACRFFASLCLPFSLHGYANEETAHEAPRLASAEV
jgi:hypothetical protein